MSDRFFLRARGGRRIAIEADGVTIGRDPHNRIVVEDRAVSRHHARVFAANGGLAIRDHGSINGTFLNNRRITGTVSLRSGDEVRIGSYCVYVESAPAGAAIAVGPALRAQPVAVLGSALGGPPTWPLSRRTLLILGADGLAALVLLALPVFTNGVSPITPASATLFITLLVACQVAALAIISTRHPRRSISSSPPSLPTNRVHPPASRESASQDHAVSWPTSANALEPVPAGYQIVGPPKHGGMAIVYKALQPALHRYVALKVLSPTLGADPSFVERFYAEARHTASLEHPNIVPIYELGKANDSVYITMRYIDGLSLQELLAQENQLPVERAISIVAQVAEALDYAHGRGIIHRDVKPANIMVEPGDRATLTDFGIATVAGSSQLTSAGSIVGTPDYLSPEQARGADVDARTDLYSLAVVAYEMLAGRPPFQSDNPLSVVHAQIASQPPSVTVFNPSVPPGVAAVLLRALAKEPARRFATCRGFVNGLRQAVTATV